MIHGLKLTGRWFIRLLIMRECVVKMGNIRLSGIAGMIECMGLVVLIGGCSAAPTAPAQVDPEHGVEITASSTEINVGDEVTITGDSGGVGMADMGMTFSSGGEIHAMYNDRTIPVPGVPDTMF